MDKIYRIRLKLLSKIDLTEKYFSWHKAEHTKYFSSTKRSFSHQSLKKEFETGEKEKNLFHYGIYHIYDDSFIGVIKIGIINKIHMTSDMVVLIGDKSYLGKGLASEAIQLGNDIAFNIHMIRKLYGGMYKDNIGSVKAYLKANWIIEGVLKNQYVQNSSEQDRILVACFNPKFYQDEYYSKGMFSFNQIYGIKKN